MDILLIDDELELRETLAEAIRDAGHSISEAGDGRAAAALIAAKDFDVILCDVHLPDTDGLTLLRTIRKEAPLTDFMLMTAFADVGDAVAALKEGATGLPDEAVRPRRAVAPPGAHRRGSLDAARARRGPPRLGDARAGQPHRGSLVADAQGSSAGRDDRAQRRGDVDLRRERHGQRAHRAPAPRAEPAGVAALRRRQLRGVPRGLDRGRALRLRARRLHGSRQEARRWRFADGRWRHPVPRRDRGVAAISPAQAVKLLRVLQDGVIEPLGTDQSVTVDVRLISATHRNLRERVAQGAVPRGSVLSNQRPRCRAAAARAGARRRISRRARRVLPAGLHATDGRRRKTRRPVLSADAYAAISAYRFPGNVRELGHAIEHAVVLAGDGEISLDHPAGGDRRGGPRRVGAHARAVHRGRRCPRARHPADGGDARVREAAPAAGGRLGGRQARQGGRARGSRARASGRSSACTISRTPPTNPTPNWSLSLLARGRLTTLTTASMQSRMWIANDVTW